MPATPKDPARAIRSSLKAGVTLEQLAAASGVPLSTIHSWLRRGVPSAVLAFAAVTASARTLAAEKRRQRAGNSPR